MGVHCEMSTSSVVILALLGGAAIAAPKPDGPPAPGYGPEDPHNHTVINTGFMMNTLGQTLLQMRIQTQRWFQEHTQLLFLMEGYRLLSTLLMTTQAMLLM